MNLEIREPELERRVREGLESGQFRNVDEMLKKAFDALSSRTAALDWSQCSAVESVPGKVSGAWVFRDTRMPVSTVFENLEAGATMEEIMEWFDVTREQIRAVLEFASKSLATPPNAHPV